MRFPCFSSEASSGKLMFKHVFFDMDGTVLESGPGVTNGVAYTLEKFGIHESDKTSLLKFIGPPLKDSFKNFYGFTEEQCDKALQYFREYYEPIGLYESSIYQGIPELCRNLKKQGIRTYIASSKPEVHIVDILERNGISDCFDFVAGADLQEIRVKKEDIINYIIEENNLSDAIKNGEVIMVGDRKFDIIGAAQFGIKTIGVLYGYGSEEEFRQYGAFATAKDAAELEKLLLQSR